VAALAMARIVCPLLTTSPRNTKFKGLSGIEKKMEITLPLEKMTIAEKLRVMESLWRDLSRISPTDLIFTNGRRQGWEIIFRNRCFPTLNLFDFTWESIPSGLGTIGCCPSVSPTPSVTIRKAFSME
jgi:hypothetical protein